MHTIHILPILCMHEYLDVSCITLLFYKSNMPHKAVCYSDFTMTKGTSLLYVCKFFQQEDKKKLKDVNAITIWSFETVSISFLGFQRLCWEPCVYKNTPHSSWPSFSVNTCSGSHTACHFLLDSFDQRENGQSGWFYTKADLNTKQLFYLRDGNSISVLRSCDYNQTFCYLKCLSLHTAYCLTCYFYDICQYTAHLHSILNTH